MNSLDSISSYSILLPGGMVFLSLKHSFRELNYIRLIVLLALICEITTFTYINFCDLLHVPNEERNNMFVFHFFVLAETIILSIYFRTFTQNQKLRFLYLIIALVFSIFYAIDLTFWESIKEYPAISSTVKCILVILFCITFFIQLFQKSEVINLLEYPHFWMVSGLLLFYSGTFFMNIVGDLVIKENDIGFDIYAIHSYLNIFLNIIYTITLWLGSRRLVLAR